MKKRTFFQVSEIELTYKSKIKATDRPKITNSQNAYNILMNHWSDSIEFVEEFNLLLLNRANDVLGFINLSKGGVSATVVDVKLVFAASLKANASAIIISHNHPSGSLFPSEHDKDLTDKIIQAGKLLDITVLDHLIVSPLNYFSFKDEGMLD